MPKLALINTNFTGGELSPYLYGRVDVAKYNHGAAVMENLHPIVQGGAVSREGSRYLGVALGDGYLVPFVYARGTAYQVELTLGHIRIWTQDGSLVPAIDFATPWDAAGLDDLTFEQAEDTMFFFHVAHTPFRLQRLSATKWTFEPVPFVTEPFGEGGFSSTVDVTLSTPTVGTGRTLTAVSAVFLPGDVGREFSDGLGGLATIVAFSDPTLVNADVTAAFVSTAITSWHLAGSPNAFVFPVAKDPVGSTTTLHGATPRAATITLSALTGAITVDASASVFVPGDTGGYLFSGPGVAVLTYVSGTQCTAVTSTDFLQSVYQAGAWGATGGVFRNDDVGSFVSANGGLFKITGIASAVAVSAEIRQASTALVAAPPFAWTLAQSVFGPITGYPRCGALHEQRLWLGGTESAPDTLLASIIGEYLDFEAGLGDADGLSYKLAMRQRNPIRHLVSGKRLFALTEGAETSLRGGNEKAIGPTNIQKDNESSFGASAVIPVTIAKEVIYVQGAGRKVRALGYSAAIEGFDSPDRTVFAEHVTLSGVRDMAYQPEEFSLLYCVRNDGQMAVAAYDVGQEVIAWSRYVTDGRYRSVSVIPNDTSDDVWTIVDRPDLDGFPRYFVERFEPGLATDCAGTVVIDDGIGVGVLSISGLSRFEGRELAVKADGVFMGSLDVAGGIVALPREAFDIEAGLPFVPTLELLPPEVGSGGGTAQGSNVSVHEVAIRLLDTATLEVNGTESDFRRFGTALLDQPPPGFTGDYRVIKLTDNFIRDRLVIRQPKPFKCHVQAVIRKVTVNDV